MKLDVYPIVKSSFLEIELPPNEFFHFAPTQPHAMLGPAGGGRRVKTWLVPLCTDPDPGPLERFCSIMAPYGAPPREDLAIFRRTWVGLKNRLFLATPDDPQGLLGQAWGTIWGQWQCI